MPPRVWRGCSWCNAVVRPPMGNFYEFRCPDCNSGDLLTGSEQLSRLRIAGYDIALRYSTHNPTRTDKLQMTSIRNMTNTLQGNTGGGLRILKFSNRANTQPTFAQVFHCFSICMSFLIVPLAYAWVKGSFQVLQEVWKRMPKAAPTNVWKPCRIF
jgi:hypothetical protein